MGTLIALPAVSMISDLALTALDCHLVSPGALPGGILPVSSTVPQHNNEMPVHNLHTTVWMLLNGKPHWQIPHCATSMECKGWDVTGMACSMHISTVDVPF